ncbi:hypothetical protein PX554_06485 [Sphingomonas sp. H39-1-10]|uniref:hypothetical protein n=1 Tax=Sphingomonas pollutisoli TaxID=3030829 RepID=UPI0023B8E1E7|nr:hypothetical protein [Sphingomonas pollutisoli]MDF0487771.1 hypothetical protein [Sphingomonas pollutisoli]
MKPEAPETGFSVVEALVALAIIAAMTSLLFEAISTSARAHTKIADKREAILLAQSLLAQATISQGVGDLPPSGQTNRFRWRVTNRIIDGGARDTGVPLQEVKIDVADRGSGQSLVRVQTLRLER